MKNLPRTIFAKDLTLGFLIAALVFSISLSVQSVTRDFDGVFFSTESPIVGGFAVIDWLGVFLAFTFLTGWILCLSACKFLIRFPNFRVFGLVSIPIILFIISVAVGLSLNLSMPNSQFDTIIQSCQNTFTLGVFISTYIFVTTEKSIYPSS